MGGGVTFCFRPNIKAVGYPEITIKSKWEEWRAGWFLVEVPAPSGRNPRSAATRNPSSSGNVLLALRSAIRDPET